MIYELRSKFSEDNQKQMISSFLNADDEVGKQRFEDHLLLTISGVRVQQREPLVADANGHSDRENLLRTNANRIWRAACSIMG